MLKRGLILKGKDQDGKGKEVGNSGTKGGSFGFENEIG